MRIRSSILLALLLWWVPGGMLVAQNTASDTLNRTDEQGRRTGHWVLRAPQPEKNGYTAGELTEEGRYQAGKRVGVWRRYWPGGKPMSEITYVMGRPRGPYTTWYPDGKVEEQGAWDLDRNTGTFKRWHPNGKLAQEFIFDQHGVRNGVQRYYHENGQLAVEVNVVNGQEEGTMKRFLPNGQVQSTADFHEGDLGPGGIREVRSAESVQPKPEANAAPAPVVTQEEQPNIGVFRADGFNTLYDKQLRLSQVGEFKKGKLWKGRVYKYSSNGELKRIELYEQGRYVGNKPITAEDLN
ncbi:MAG: hypothetical protein JNM31_10255 [Flavobacteriales bacterium]|nr:hypothetical protein [Flavobacteriales bacterium]